MCKQPLHSRLVSPLLTCVPPEPLHSRLMVAMAVLPRATSPLSSTILKTRTRLGWRQITHAQLRRSVQRIRKRDLVRIKQHSATANSHHSSSQWSEQLVCRSSNSSAYSYVLRSILKVEWLAGVTSRTQEHKAVNAKSAHVYACYVCVYTRMALSYSCPPLAEEMLLQIYGAAPPG